MTTALPASLIDMVAGLELGAIGGSAGNRVSLEGLTFGAGPEGRIEIAIRTLAAASLRLAAGSLLLEVGELALHDVAAQLRTDAGKLRLCAATAAGAEISGVKVEGPLLPRQTQAPPEDGTPGHAANAWCLEPLATADGTIRAEIVDAHLLFDADVTVPIRHGRVDFNDATVEHVGPDSRMGISRLGLYVDAPNGRSYLYQFASALVCGVEYERRGALLGPWVTSRGHVQLRPFGEGLLRQGWRGPGQGFTEQARLLFGRTALSGDVQLGDGSFAAPGVQAVLAGRGDGRNLVRVHSEAVGRGLTVGIASLLVRDAVLTATGLRLGAAEITGSPTLRLSSERGQLRFLLELARVNVSGLRLDAAADT